MRGAGATRTGATACPGTRTTRFGGAAGSGAKLGPNAAGGTNRGASFFPAGSTAMSAPIAAATSAPAAYRERAVAGRRGTAAVVGAARMRTLTPYVAAIVVASSRITSTSASSANSRLTPSPAIAQAITPRIERSSRSKERISIRSLSYGHTGNSFESAERRRMDASPARLLGRVTSHHERHSEKQIDLLRPCSSRLRLTRKSEPG